MRTLLFLEARKNNGASMPTFRRDVRNALRDGQLRADSFLIDVKGIGPYLNGRLSTVLRKQDPRIRDFWRHTARLNDGRLKGFLHRTFQNGRGNECVSPGSTAGARSYHAPDVNHGGFDAALALLEHGATIGAVNYRQLPAMPRRGSASKGCGCRPLAQCTGVCQVVSGVCVPRNARRGFVGADTHPDQIVSVANDGELRSVRSRARVRLTAAHRDDPDADGDWRSGMPKSKRYVSRGNRAWRVPGPVARLPMQR